MRCYFETETTKINQETNITTDLRCITFFFCCCYREIRIINGYLFGQFVVTVRGDCTNLSSTNYTKCYFIDLLLEPNINIYPKFHCPCKLFTLVT